MKKDTSYATSSLVCGVLSFVPLLNFVTSPLAIIFGIIGLRKIKQSPRKFAGEKRAIVGLVLGSIVILFSIIALLRFGPEVVLTRR